MSFKVGQKVVCQKPVFHIIKDEIYTVVDIIIIREEVAIKLKEIKDIDNIEQYYSSWRFRPLHDEIVESIITQVTEKPVVIR